MFATLDAKRPPRDAAAHRFGDLEAYGSMMGPSYAPLRSFSRVERADARFAYPWLAATIWPFEAFTRNAHLPFFCW